MEKIINITNINETEHLAGLLAEVLYAGDTVLLSGDLGAGKTTFTQFLGKNLGVKRHMTSPTFNIIKSYPSPVKECQIHHMDCYRLEGSDEDLGFDEYFDGTSIVIVEWPQFIEAFLPEENIAVSIEHIDETSRRFILSATAAKSHLVEEIYEKFTH